ncbi:hypothetical protein RRG08_032769 [Elysia crispata]|uniref:Uncharacterized protein n=1 Tax=Elysia crispata TaxID=231223 RepID=A0AAE1D2P0_9GAST|nr:hypothetical protein RRG08_032769 [Elysia crispata]
MPKPFTFNKSPNHNQCSLGPAHTTVNSYPELVSQLAAIQLVCCKPPPWSRWTAPEIIFQDGYVICPDIADDLRPLSLAGCGHIYLKKSEARLTRTGAVAVLKQICSSEKGGGVAISDET